MIIRFGKHAGEEVEELPSSYLRWLAENIQPGKYNNDQIIDCAQQELARRDHDDDHDRYERN